MPIGRLERVFALRRPSYAAQRLADTQLPPFGAGLELPKERIMDTDEVLSSIENYRRTGMKALVLAAIATQEGEFTVAAWLEETGARQLGAAHALKQELVDAGQMPMQQLSL